jgi:hypothetical protein
LINQLQASNRLFKVSVKKSDIRRSLNAYADGIKYPKIIKDSIKNNIDIKKCLEVWHFYKEMDAQNISNKVRAQMINHSYGRDSNKFFTNGLEFASQFKDWYVMSGKSKGQVTETYKDLKKATAKKTILDRDYEGIEFFFFGDLIDVLLDSVHLSPVHKGKTGHEIAKNRNIRTVVDKPFSMSKSRTRGAKLGYYFKPDPIKILLSSFRWYEWNHETKTFDSQYSNLADIPIALDWFADWFGEEIIKKKLNYYPIVPFIKKLAQTVVTRLLGEVCFEVGSDKRVLFRATTDFGLITKGGNLKRYKEKNTTDLIEEFHTNSRTAQMLTDKGTYIIDYLKDKRLNKLPLVAKSKSNTDEAANNRSKDAYMNYVVIYPANASSFEYMTKNGADQWLRAGIPEFKQKQKVLQYFKDGTHAPLPEVMI